MLDTVLITMVIYINMCRDFLVLRLKKKPTSAMLDLDAASVP
jgi:hypothetical protein